MTHNEKSPMTIEYFEFDVTDSMYEIVKGWEKNGPFLLVKLDGEAIGLLDAIPNLDTVEYAEGCTNQTEEWIERYKNKYDGYVLVFPRKIKQSEFDTYRHLKALPVMTYAFHLPKPEVGLTTFGVIECTTS